MSNNNTFVSEKKKALLAYKEKILEELRYYEKRIEDERSQGKVEYYLDDASSDSDGDFCITDHGQSLTQLKLEQSRLRTCLQATHELTSLQILQSEVNVIVNDPVLTGEPPVKSPGTWREVTAECRIDLVPFSITFYNHKANAKFGASSYRGLNVMLVKAAHDAELSKSVLPTVVRPSDAVEVLRSYAEAYRSRRNSLARLATKYGDSLYMEPLEEGGYLLKCANLLQVAWRLENKWSPLAPFHHRMKFDLEYMEEKYINTITQCHKQLSDPTISTDERTLLLSKIIATCLEANPVSESADSDQDSRLPKRRATLDQEIDEPENKKKKEVMAPPKSLPKKAKVTKTAENSRPNDNSDTHRTVNNRADNSVDNNARVNENAGSRECMPNNSKSGQKIAEKPIKDVAASKNIESSTNKENINAEIDPKNKPKKPKTTTQSKNPDKQSNNAEKGFEKPKSGKKSEVKDKTKPITNNKNNVDSGAKRQNSKEEVAKTNQLNEDTGTVNKNKQKDGNKNSNTAVENGKNVGKKNNNSSEKKDEGKKNSPNENITSAKTNKPAQSNKKTNKENTNSNNTKHVKSNDIEKAVPKATEKPQSLGSSQKSVEKNANNKLKDNIVDIAKKASTVKAVNNVKNNPTTNKVVGDNKTVKRQITKESNDMVDAKTKTSNTEKIANSNNVNKVKPQITNGKGDNNSHPTKRQTTTESNDVPQKTKKSTNTEKAAGKNNVANVKNKISTNKEADNDLDKQNSPERNGKTVNSNTLKNINKKASDKYTILHKANVAHTATSSEKDKPNHPKAKSQETIDKVKENTTKPTKKSVLPLRMQNNFKMARKSIGNIKAGVAKENNAKIKSKIPQKKLSPLNENVLKKNPLRMSPRHMAATFNSTSSLTKQSVHKSNTNIPRLAKPMFKVK